MAETRWDAVAVRFRGPTGRFVPESAVRGAIDDLVSTAGDRLAALTDRLKGGALPLAEWQTQMAHELKLLHMATATVAHGGKAAMAPTDYGWVGSAIKRQYDYLAGFALDMAQGKPVSAGRARLYAEAARQTFEEMRHRDARTRGVEQERWVRRAAESCSGCRAQSGRGWVALGQLPRLGSQQCRTRCKCYVQTRHAPVEVAA
jgi:hypothetical protein